MQCSKFTSLCRNVLLSLPLTIGFSQEVQSAEIVVARDDWVALYNSENELLGSGARGMCSAGTLESPSRREESAQFRVNMIAFLNGSSEFSYGVVPESEQLSSIQAANVLAVFSIDGRAYNRQALLADGILKIGFTDSEANPGGFLSNLRDGSRLEVSVPEYSVQWSFSLSGSDAAIGGAFRCAAGALGIS